MKVIRYNYSQVLASLFCLMLVLGTGSFAYGYHFFEADKGGCKWTSFGPGNVDFLVDGSSTSTIGDSLLTEVTAARDSWNNISTAKDVLGNFTKAGVDYIDTNFGSAWGIGVTSGAADGQFEVVLDETGDILTNVFSLSPTNINGFGPSKRTVSGGACTITDAFNLLNGSRSNFDRPSTTFHEFGHIQGLAHSSVGEFNSRNNTAFSGGFASPSAALDPINISNVPTMHPFSGGTGSNRSTPEQDDKAGLSELYPETSFTSTLGSISGTVTRCSDGTALEGVNVRAVSTTSSSLQVTRYSAFDSNGTGRYVISGLPPGDYKVIIEPMGFNGFTAGRMAIKTRIDSEFPTEYYGPTADEENNCTEEIPDTPLNVSVAAGDPVSVTAGATTPNINIKVGGVKLAFVVDDTGSMGSEITAVRDMLNLFVNTLEGLAAIVPGLTFPDTAIVTFKDNVTLRKVSNDPAELRTVIDALFASGGGDCPESSNAALIEAGKLLVRGGVAILFTDADSRSDGPNRTTVSNFYRSKSLTFSVLLSATCSTSFSFDSSDEVEDLIAYQEDGGPIGPFVSIADEFPPEPTLGVEDAVTTYSSIASETGGIFRAVSRPFSGTAKDSYVNTGTNLSVSSVVPAVATVTPGSGPSGATFNVLIEGANTNWSQTGSTVAFAGFTEVVNSFTVNSPTSITANITIPPGIDPVFIDVTVTTTLSSAEPEIANGVGAFQIVTASGFDDIISIAPPKGSLGATLDVEITGIDTNFDGTTTVSFRKAFTEDTKITVNTVTVKSPTTLSVNITIASDADIGLRDVRITTGTEITTESNGFLVTSTPLAIARVTNVVPASGKRGTANLDVVITGENTNFVDGTSVASFSGTGITVVSTTVTSPTQATARITILSSAALGFRDVLVSTGDETAVLLNGFLIKISGAINITANGLNGPITLGPTDTLSIKVDTAVGASAGIPVDWWVAAETPFGWFYLDLSTGFIFAGASPFDIKVTFQGPLADISPPFEVFNISASDLPSGTYTFYFAVDTDMNGVLDLDKVVFDFVRVIKP